MLAAPRFWWLALMAWGGAALAGDWSAEMPGGLRVSVVQDAARTREGYVLERRYPDGRLDAQFGDEGSVVFSLGADNAGPAALRLDVQGRAWIAGASLGADGRSQAVLLRFRTDGRPDGGFGSQGRSATAPAGREARATDVQPLDDGSAWVAGVVIDRQGGERSGAWRVGPDGRVDTRFGLGGLWVDDRGGDTDIGGLARGPDGEVALGLRRADGQRGTLEIWTWRGLNLPQRVAAETVDLQRLDTARLVRRDGGWGWSGAGPAAPGAPRPATAASARPPAASEAPAAALALPFAGQPAPPAASTPAVVAPAAAPDLGAAWWLMLPGGGLLAWWAWRLRRARER